MVANLHSEVILESISDGVFTIDYNWKITSFNHAAQKITGIASKDAIGRYCWEVLHSNMCEQECTLKKLRLKEAEEHKMLQHVASTWEMQNNRLIAGVGTKGPRVINFANVLQYGYFPLAKIIDEILLIGNSYISIMQNINKDTI